jgi:tetratricopeptide (TPR) repeat protein/Zn-dependent protease with chaperone function
MGRRAFVLSFAFVLAWSSLAHRAALAQFRPSGGGSPFAPSQPSGPSAGRGFPGGNPTQYRDPIGSSYRPNASSSDPWQGGAQPYIPDPLSRKGRWSDPTVHPSSPYVGPTFRNPLSRSDYTGYRQFNPQPAARFRSPAFGAGSSDWTQAREVFLRGDVAAARSAIDQRVAADGSLSNVMSAVSLLEQVDAGADAINPYRSRALQLAREQIDRGANDPLPWVAVGKFSLEDGDHARFQQASESLLTRFPSDPHGHYFQGVQLMEQGDWKGAEAALRRAEALGMPQESVAEMLKLAIDNQKWIWEYTWLVLWVVVGWIASMVGLYLAGAFLSRLTVASIHRWGGPIPSRQRALRLAYRWVVDLAGVFYFLSLPVVLVISVALPLAVGYALLMVPVLNLWLAAFVLIACSGGVLTSVSAIRAAFVRVPDTPIGRSLQPTEAPALWKLTRDVAQRVGTRPVDEIWLTPGTDVSVVERGGLWARMRDRGRRVLVLGLSALPGFKQDALRAVIAHEYGHFQNRDTAGGNIALRVNLAMQNLAEALVARRKIRWYDTAVQFLRVYHFIFRRLAFGASRLQEVLADRLVVVHYGASAFREGLLHVIRRSVEFDQALSYAVACKVRSEPASMYSIMRLPEPRTLEDRESIETVIDELVSRESTMDDSHPSPKERFALALRVGLDAPVGRCEVMELLGDDRPRLAYEMQKLVNEGLELEAEEISAFQKFILNVLTEGLNKGPRAEIFEQRAAVYLDRGMYREALADLNTALSLIPNMPSALYGRALTHEKMRNFHAALGDMATLARHVQQAPLDQRFDIYYTLGKLHLELNQFADAVKTLTQALDCRPRSLAAIVARARAARRAGNISEALTDLDQAAETWPEVAEVFAERAQAHEAGGQLHLAAADRSPRQSIGSLANRRHSHPGRSRSNRRQGNPLHRRIGDAAQRCMPRAGGGDLARPLCQPPDRIPAIQFKGPAVHVLPRGRARNAQRPVDRGRQVLRRLGILSRVGGDLVRRADYVSAAYARPGQEHCHGRAPVVAPGVLVDLGRAAELARQHDQRRLQQAALRKVVEQARHGPVQVRQQIVLQVHKIPAVRVPRRVLAQVYLHQVRPRRHEPRRHEQGEAELVLAVPLERLGVGVFHVEGLADFRIGQHGNRKLPVPVQLGRLCRPLQLALPRFDVLEEPQPAGQAQPAALGQREGWRLQDRGRAMFKGRPLEPEAVRAGAVAQGAGGGHVKVPRLVRLAHSPGELPGPDAADFVNAGLRQHDRRRQVVPAARGVGHLRGDRRPFIGAGGLVDVEAGGEIEAAREQHVAGFLVAVALRADGAHQGVLSAPLGQQRQVLADLHARRARGDGPELPADGVGRVGLEVEAVLVR